MSKPVKLIALLKAKPGMTREEFAKRWIEGHAPLTLKFENLKGYRINVAIEEYQELEGELPYDGTDCTVAIRLDARTNGLTLTQTGDKKKQN